MDKIINKYSNSVLKNLNKDNINNIIFFLKKENCALNYLRFGSKKTAEQIPQLLFS